MRKVALLAVLQIGAMLGWAGVEEAVRENAPVFRIPLQPADPHDLLRGRYFRLNPADSRLKLGDPDVRLSREEVDRFLAGEKKFEGPALVGFCPEGELQRLCALSAVDGMWASPAGSVQAGFWSRAQVEIQWETDVWRNGERVPSPGWRVTSSLGLGRFFLPERLELPAHESDRGWELELAHRPGRTPLPTRLYFKGRLVFES